MNTTDRRDAHMRYLALCTDYDGTIAHHGKVDDRTLAALERFRQSGRKLVLVTGRELPDLRTVFSRFDLFDLVVAENGALLYWPERNEERVIGEAPPQEFIEALRERGVGPLSVGRSIVATWEPHENTVLDTIRDFGLELQVIFNKGAVMILPAGVNKASGLSAALAELNICAHNAVGVGDAENDHAFLSMCECAVAVANALPSLKEKADFVTEADHGAGVAQLIEEILADELRHREPALVRHHIELGTDEGDRLVRVPPYGPTVLLVGTSGGGKSSATTGFVERLADKGYSFCIIDPEGDYDNVESAIVLGNPKRAPTLEECMDLLREPTTNAVINLVGLPLQDRPQFFLALLAHIHENRLHTGRPHWVLVDEAHHVLPSQTSETQAAAQPLHSALLVSVRPSSIAPKMLECVDTLMILGEEPQQMLDEFARAIRARAPHCSVHTIESGAALLWQRSCDDGSGESERTTLVKLTPTRTERRRHLRKYAEGQLPEDRSFYFRGPDQRLRLRAPNLILFLDLADGVDDETWLHHLRNGDVVSWLRKDIKDESLAEEVERIQNSGALDPAGSRRQVRQLIESKYTLPA